MADQNQVIRDLIQELVIPEEQKNALFSKLEANGVTEDLLAEMQQHVSQMEQAEKASVAQEMKDLAQAEAEFNLEMDKIDEEGAKLEKELTANLDQIDIDSVRDQISAVK